MYDKRRRGTLILAVATAAVACMAVVPSASAAPARQAGSAQRLAAFNPWGRAQEVPGITALSEGFGALITSVSCASAGNCSAGGYYLGNNDSKEAFVVSEVQGRWRKAEEVPGIAALDTGDFGEITSVSCASAGNCSAGGFYLTPSSLEAFVVSEVHGRWRRAEEVPGIAALNTDGDARLTSVSCASAGNCSAGGYLTSGFLQDGTYIFQPFVVSEVHGTWREAEEVPGAAALNIGGFAGLTSVSCASAGNCSAGGYFQDASFKSQAFVVSEVNGTWQVAEEVPGTGALNTGGYAGITSVSCASAGNCSAAGWYWVGGSRAFVVSEVHGTWRKAEQVPGTGKLNKGRDAGMTSVSCASAGNCIAGGFYTDRSHRTQAFVVSEVHGTWRKAEEVRRRRGCSASGSYEDSSAKLQAFVVSRN